MDTTDINSAGIVKPRIRYLFSNKNRVEINVFIPYVCLEIFSDYKIIDTSILWNVWNIFFEKQIFSDVLCLLATFASLWVGSHYVI